MSSVASRDGRIQIRPAVGADADAVWRIFRAVIAGGDTYAFAPDTGREAGAAYFLGPAMSSWVAEIDGRVVAIYKLIPNGPDLGSHVANASFIVDPSAQGRGIGRAMGEHCLVQAKQAGYQAMQFNFVVSTNTAAVRLWKTLGFSIVGTLPKAFNHAHLGLVDAFVMHRFL